MNKIKETWSNDVNKILEEHFGFENVKIVFKANEETNKFFYNTANENDYLMGDVVYLINDSVYYVFEFFTDDRYEYRFSSKNKFFYKINRETKERTQHNTNWIDIFKKNKINLDKFNGQYNNFFLKAKYINFDGAGKGIYGVNDNSLKKLLEFKPK